MKRQKSFILFYIFVIAILTTACAPANPPKIEKSSVIIDLCYKAMGQSGEQLQKNLADIGIDVPKIDPSSGYENYYVKTHAYELAYSTIDDKVVIFRYELRFGGSMLIGLNRDKEISDLVFNYGWAEWSGHSQRNHSEQITERDSFWEQVQQDKHKNTEHHSGVLERMARPYGEQTLWGSVHLYHVVTDKGILVEFEINNRTREEE